MQGRTIPLPRQIFPSICFHCQQSTLKKGKSMLATRLMRDTCSNATNWKWLLTVWEPSKDLTAGPYEHQECWIFLGHLQNIARVRNCPDITISSLWSWSVKNQPLSEVLKCQVYRELPGQLNTPCICRLGLKWWWIIGGATGDKFLWKGLLFVLEVFSHNEIWTSVP